MTKQEKRSRLLERKRERLLREVSTFTGDRGSLGAISESLNRKRLKTIDRIQKDLKNFNKQARILNEIKRMGYKELEERASKKYEKLQAKAIKGVLSINPNIEKGVKKDYKSQVRHFAKLGKTTQKKVMESFKITPGTVLNRINNRFFYLENIELFQEASRERAKLNKARARQGKLLIKGRLGVGAAVSELEGDINIAYRDFKKKLTK